MPVDDAGLPPAIVDGTEGPFVGRQTSFDRLGCAFARVRAGSPAMALVEGPAGIGKTALVARFLARTDARCVLRASGEEAEMGLPFGVLDQIWAAAASIAGSPSRAGGPEVDPLVAGADLVELLGEAQSAGPMVLVVEDAHWADRLSLHALAFTLRRLRFDRVLTLVTVRDVTAPQLPDGVRRLLTGDDAVRVRLAGLDTGELRVLGARLGCRPMSRRAAERLRAHTEGNPLYVRALLDQVPADAIADVDTPLPAPRSYTMLTVARMASCDPDTEALVGAAAVLGVRGPLQLAGAVAGLSDPLPSLEGAVQAGLLVEHAGDRTVGFPHPLTHAAVYQQLGPVRRAELHARAASLTDDQATRLRHRAAAASGPDAQLAAELASLGRQKVHAGAWAAAANHLVAAAGLVSSRADHEQLSLEAIECLSLAGEVVDLDRETARVRSFRESGWRSYLLARLSMSAGRLRDAEEWLTDAWARCDVDADPALGARIAGQLALIHSGLLRLDKEYAWAMEALRLAPEQTTTDMIHCRPLSSRCRSGLGEEAIASVADLPSPALASVADLDRLLGRAELRLYTDDPLGACRDLAGVVAAGHERSAAFQIFATGTLALSEYRSGHWDDGAAHGALALSLAIDTEHHLALYCQAIAALVPAARGDWATAEEHTRMLTESGYAGPDLAVSLGRACLAHARGDTAAVVDALVPLIQPDPPSVGEPAVLFWVYQVLDVLPALGDYAQADAILRPFEELARGRARRSAMAGAARARAALEASRGNTAAADTSYQAGLGYVANLALPFDRALLHLSYGAFLRRGGQRRAASKQLDAAHDVLAGLGARPYLEQCQRELRACGLTPRDRRDHDTSILTPQESTVARRAVDLTNREVARELFISVKTVEFHLRNIYMKLGVTSRMQLRERLGERP
ncbi:MULTISPECIES: LuxR family transcriptional regulator [unclassified Pseudofrankia]|uniref:helix-turn-helix transcriptional regulator n=1 Tax=unclassified Pseudofrankia TaxID=2994372 RepID=UPI0008D9E4FB|nr:MULTISPECIES: LuxR family transcriptional regulator [unclassified Pseudofrankia]MDT3439328.1 AAA family ATPase [Pseudofrankia sp. BMG5.37]OHV73948.1 hypothetical protein BCD48_32930 [Pseudofrankia sp. BMG5.36]